MQSILEVAATVLPLLLSAVAAAANLLGQWRAVRPRCHRSLDCVSTLATPRSRPLMVTVVQVDLDLWVEARGAR